MKTLRPYLMFVVALLLASCLQERPSEQPPIHINPNMDTQPKYRAYQQSPFFDNQSAMRTPVAGTMAQPPAATSPAMSSALTALQHGQQRYNIYCSPCHSRVGDGKGIVVQRGMLPPPSFHEARLRQVNDAYLYDVISNGIRNMPAYRAQIPEQDRWAIVRYIRALQLSQHARLTDLPGEVRQQFSQKKQP